MIAPQRDVAGAPLHLGGTLVTSVASRSARARNFTEAPGETSSQSMLSSGGPANASVRRSASAPYSPISLANVVALRERLDIFLPSDSTMPWFISALNGSVKLT